MKGVNNYAFQWLGKDYCDIAEKRIANKREEIAKIKEKGMEKRKKEGIQDKLFWQNQFLIKSEIWKIMYKING